MKLATAYRVDRGRLVCDAFFGGRNLPENVSGLTLVAPEVGSLVVANVDHHYLRRRFSYAHEYCHVLLDRARRAAISRAEERDQVAAVRANAFAASFLMPGEGVHDFIEGLAKGRPSQLRGARPGTLRVGDGAATVVVADASVLVNLIHVEMLPFVGELPRLHPTRP